VTPGWLAYAVVVSLLAGLGAAAAERVLRLYELPARGAWLAAMLASIGLPLAAHIAGGSSVISPAVLPPLGVGEAVSGVAVAAGGDGTLLPALESALGWTWAALSAAASLWLVTSAFRLHRFLDGLRTRTVGDVSVHVTAEEGPACWALPGRRARVLLPSWLWELAPDARRLAVAHEREHLRRGDSVLSGFGWLVVAAAPWNLPLWWHLRRLRRAVELDCDGRVLCSDADPRAYGDLLLTVGGRRSTSPWTAVPLSESESGLEGRIRRMVAPPPEHRAVRAAAFGVLAAAAAVLACEAAPPGPAGEPVAPRPSADASVGVEAPSPGSGGDSRALAERPTFIPYDVAPELQNPSRVQAVLEEQYPEAFQDSGVGGTVVLWMYVDEQGEVRRSRVRESSGYRALDEAAMEVAQSMEFSPALNRDDPTAVWVQQRIQFQVE